MTAGDALTPFLLLAAAPFVGSFLGTVAVRLPQGRSSLWGRSACLACGRRLGVLDLVPVVGFALRRGRCAGCGAAIPWIHPVVEIAAFGAALWGTFNFQGWRLAVACLLGWSLLVLAATDLRRFVLPDAITLPLTGAGIAVAAAGGLGPAPPDLAASALAAAAGFLFLYAVSVVYRRLRGRDGLGLGDAKLFAAAGAWTGFLGLPSVLLVAALTGLGFAVGAALVRGQPLHGGIPVPFGSHLAFALWIVVVYGPLFPRA